MKIKLFNSILFLFIPFLMFSQSTSNEKLLEMKNSFTLGLKEKGLELATELISRNEHKDVREETVFYIAEYHFINSLITPSLEDKAFNSNVAYTYYLIYKNDYPNSKYSSKVNERITSLSSTVSQWAILKNLFDYYTEGSIVENSIEFTNKLFTINPPNPYQIFFEGENEGEAIKILERYYDDIIINHPDFEIYGYYWKIISNLSLLSGVNYFSKGLMDYNVDKISLGSKDFMGNVTSYSSEFKTFKNKLLGWLEYLNTKYAHHPITLDLNLVFAKIFMKVEDGAFDMDTKKHIEFVVQNELDKTHPRYMLAKEFLLNNKFK